MNLKWLYEDMGLLGLGPCPRWRLVLPMGNVMVETHSKACAQKTGVSTGWVMRCDGLGLRDKLLVAKDEEAARLEATNILYAQFNALGDAVMVAEVPAKREAS